MEMPAIINKTTTHLLLSQDTTSKSCASKFQDNY
ncbi:hypothetical protein [Sicyoidochytrium minutum DNA virus]|nr:hypothetical protein [Sicyoidochytrium minutum DNA virus]